MGAKLRYVHGYYLNTQYTNVFTVRNKVLNSIGRLKVALSVTFIPVIPTHVHLSLNFPAKAHSTPSFSTPVFSTPAFSAPP